MSSTLRNATDHTVHTLTDLVDEARQHLDLSHIDLPHIDLARLTGHRRRTLSPACAAVLGVAAVVVIAGYVRRRRAAASADSTSLDARPIKTEPAPATATPNFGAAAARQPA